MGRGKGVEVRPNSIRLRFQWQGEARYPTLMTNGAPMAPTPANIRFAERLVAEVREKIRNAKILLWKGHCSVHQMFQPVHIDRWRDGDWAKWQGRVEARDLFDAAPAVPAPPVAAEPIQSPPPTAAEAAPRPPINPMLQRRPNRAPSRPSW